MKILAALVIVVHTAIASQYAPGVMERVIRVRQQPGRTAHTLPAVLPDVDGYVAVMDCSRIGSVVLLRPVGASLWERFLVTDCAGIADGGRDWMLRNGIVAEIDHATAERWDVVGIGVHVEVGVASSRLLCTPKGVCVQ